jgi:hypothetical protein
LFDHFVFDQIWLPRYVTLEKGLVTLYPVKKKRKKKEEEEEETCSNPHRSRVKNYQIERK